MISFREMLERQWSEGKFVCVGLDSDIEKIPGCLKEAIDKSNLVQLAFNKGIITQTNNIVCCYKLNTAFYEAIGAEGIEVLRQTIEYINAVAPELPVILDAKRADIGNTNNGYVQFAFDYLRADAITVHPYLGVEALQPFLERKDKGVIVLCKTSNPGSDEFQDKFLSGEDKLVYEYVAQQVSQKWNKNGNCALVVGATYPKQLKSVREIVGNMPILIPGIGAQGGDIADTVCAGADSRGKGMIINSSRGIIFADDSPNFAQVARAETLKLQFQIDQYRLPL